VGYNATFTTWRDSVLGIVPAGYGLGYPVALTGRGAVRVGPRLQTAEVRGQVNMDQIIIDLTEVADPHVGMSVEIYGADPDAANAIPAVADAARTNPYEILCRLADRLPRRYLTQKPTA
jgi:alanine racemase